MSDKKKILAVDDDPDVLALLSQRLEKEGFAVVVTAEPDEVVTLVKSERPDLIICDIDMGTKPGGEVAAELDADDATRDTPLIFLSSLVEADASGTEVGGWPMFSKSASTKQLVAAISEMLDRG